MPAKPEYVSTARLTTSALASRLGFNVDDIEDLKVAVSESIIYLINQFVEPGNVNIDYHIEDENQIIISIGVEHTGSAVKKENIAGNELGIYIIESVSDKLIKNINKDIICGFTIYKSCGGST
ncbi:MAG TPA: serine/threonine protein kinase [Candidatus Atribacteria bacterium]|nr:serine/threonine protein kinase [Candidatus Atribacteria bacterium]